MTDFLQPQPDAENNPVVVHYFVDETGTPTLFARRRKEIVGKPGCSTQFVLGKLEVGDPDALDRELSELRAELLADPYFARVPSMLPENKKTFYAFHAKDDLPEIRREVFKVLLRNDVRFSAVIRDKFAVLSEVRENEVFPGYKYQENELYDSMVTDLFMSGFHEADHFRICFSQRGNKDRSRALLRALTMARLYYEQTVGISTASNTIEIDGGQPRDFAGLQAVDYFLWALQRAFDAKENSDWRYWEAVQSKVRLVHDKDDIRQFEGGVYYNPTNQLTPENLAKRVSRGGRKK